MATARSSAALRLSAGAARAVVLAAQGLAPGSAAPGALSELVERHGPLRTLGGVEAYLALRARRPGLGRAEIERAVGAGELRVRPAARGCMYVVTAKQEPLALRVADLVSRAGERRVLERAGVTEKELEKLGDAVLKVLAAGALATDAVRRALPAGCVRSLGEAGKKLGVSSPLPGALRRLELLGAIERVNLDDRLDHERYLWRIPRRDPFAAARLPAEESALFARLAELFFTAAGFATLDEFAGWAGIPKGVAKPALARLDLLPLAVEGSDALYLAPAGRRALLEDPPSGAVALLPFEDNAIALHGGPGLLVAPEFHRLEASSWGSGKRIPLAAAKHLALRAIVAEGGIAGFWEFDPPSGRVVTGFFAPVGKATAKKIAAEAAATGRFLAAEMGHAKSFTLDTDGELARRAARVRAL